MKRISRSWMNQIFWVGVLITLTSFSNFLALSIDEINMNDFVQMEGNIISKLQNYLIQEEERLNRLKGYLTDWETWRNSISGQEPQYITIPQNLFHLFKTLTLEWNELETIITENSSEKVKDIEIEPLIEDHLKLIISQIIDLQSEYDLKPEDIVNESSTSLQTNTSHALCFSVGKTCFDNNNYVCATDWFIRCLNSTSDVEFRKEITKLLYISYIFLNQTEIAYNYAIDFLNYNYFDSSTWDVVFNLGSQLQRLKGRFRDSVLANRICRGEHEISSKPNLKCRYNHENSAFLKIAPLKEEELHDAPKILLYRDILYDSEIEFVKNVTTNNMHVALLAGHSKPKFSYRVTESSFLNTDLPNLAALEKRTEDISNLSIGFSEFWQVINYSPGGFYAVHTDYLATDDSTVQKFGNRMTTILFYMNDVTLGGETVFPYIGVSARPTKGAALIWHNAHADGSKNKWMDHCACPVIIGEKWGFTKWVRQLKNQQCLQSIRKVDLKMFQAT